MLELLRRITNRKRSFSPDSKPVVPPVLEKLEPRILLSGDGLLHVAAPDPFQDTHCDDTQQVVQYAELMETNERIEEQLSSAERKIYESLFTLPADDDVNVSDGAIATDPNSAEYLDETVGDSNISNISNEVITTEILNTAAEERTASRPAVETEDGRRVPTGVHVSVRGGSGTGEGVQ